MRSPHWLWKYNHKNHKSETIVRGGHKEWAEWRSSKVIVTYVFFSRIRRLNYVHNSTNRLKTPRHVVVLFWSIHNRPRTCTGGDTYVGCAIMQLKPRISSRNSTWVSDDQFGPAGPFMMYSVSVIFFFQIGLSIKILL
jgi:hypothetical protein